jgi:hypothetical protein
MQAKPHELARARDDDASVELVETDRAVAVMPHGLAFGIRLNVEPTQALLRSLVRALRRQSPPPSGCRR